VVNRHGAVGFRILRQACDGLGDFVKTARRQAQDASTRTS
jgi:hypothetical protein